MTEENVAAGRDSAGSGVDVGDERWVLAYEEGPGQVSGPVGVRVPLGQSLLVGREGDLPLGVEVRDPGVSRRAVEITATSAGWDVTVSNSNGAVLHAWGQAPLQITGRQQLVWPRVALRILNGDRSATGPDSRLHWILFEADQIPVTPDGAHVTANTTSRTFTPKPPPPLTPEQLSALEVVFAEHLQWPPPVLAKAAKLSTAARRLGISESGVQERLSKARAKAVALGLHHAGGLVDPEYLYALVRAGFVAPPRTRMPRSEHPWPS